jgi:hypothetical protein
MTITFITTLFLMAEMLISILMVVLGMGMGVYIIILLVHMLIERYNKDSK